MEPKTLKVGIAGYGVVGKRRRIYIDAHPNFETVAVCDVTYKSNGQFDDGVKYFTDYKGLIDEDLDVLFVCLPNYLAADVTVAGLQRGMHVFCEKPPGRTVEDIERVIEAENQVKGLCLKYGFNHRYHDSVRDALDIVKSGELGSIINVRGVYGKSNIIPYSGGWRGERKYAGGGILLDQGIHMVDLMQLFCGEFAEVQSYVSGNYWEYDVEDNAYALMRNKDGQVAILHSSATQWKHSFSLEVALTEGTLILRGILSGSKSYGQEQLIKIRRSGEETGAQNEEVVNYLKDSSWNDEVCDFANAIVNGVPLESGTSADALSTMKLVFRIYHADPLWREKHNISDPDKVKVTT